MARHCACVVRKALTCCRRSPFFACTTRFRRSEFRCGNYLQQPLTKACEEALTMPCEGQNETGIFKKLASIGCEIALDMTGLGQNKQGAE
ncbi:hypothetical protein NXC12_CH00708 [Rhizobium etli]|uniref:Uncharacterized protein n=1 Tax=Rhizobium etli TaxID=29449 RepID=A0AAN1BE03_RHIET|nr:hypothetical protein NXC12_CH00708 [Rhizobium etli]